MSSIKLQLIGLVALIIAVIGSLTGSCGRVRDLAEKTRIAVMEALERAIKSPPVPDVPDPALQALVDQTTEGAVFRKDLPFPRQIRVKMVSRITYKSARCSGESLLGRQTSLISGTRNLTVLLERSGERIMVTLENCGFSKPEVVDRNGSRRLAYTPPVQTSTAAFNPVAEDLIGIPTGGKVGFIRKGKSWKSERRRDFRLAAWAGSLEPGIASIGIEAGVLQRAFWMTPRRFRPGEVISLTGETLELLLNKGARGALMLKLESFESSGGHPCGMFSVSGDYHVSGIQLPGGEVSTSDVTIRSGKVWLSLLHPLIIREELETIQTTVSRVPGGRTSRVQGEMSVSVTREWKAAVPST